MTSSVLGSVVSAVSMAGMMLSRTMATATTEPWEQVDALDDGRASVDRSSDRMLQVRGADAQRWLGDLVTADVASLRTASSRPFAAADADGTDPRRHVDRAHR